MKLSFNIGDTLYVKTNVNTIAVQCVADDPNENPSNTCKHCIFNEQVLHCFNIACRGRHFEAIERKEVE